jgi:hypothetical protein
MARGQHEVAYMCRCVVVPVSSHRDLCAQGGHSAHLCGLYGKALRLLESSLVHSSSRSPLLVRFPDASRAARIHGFTAARPRARSQMQIGVRNGDRPSRIRHRHRRSRIGVAERSRRRATASQVEVRKKYGVRVTVNRQSYYLRPRAARRADTGFANETSARRGPRCIGSGSGLVSIFLRRIPPA